MAISKLNNKKESSEIAIHNQQKMNSTSQMNFMRKDEPRLSS